jgi:hypothetical protein
MYSIQDLNPSATCLLLLLLPVTVLVMMRYLQQPAGGPQ